MEGAADGVKAIGLAVTGVRTLNGIARMKKKGSRSRVKAALCVRACLPRAEIYGPTRPPTTCQPLTRVMKLKLNSRWNVSSPGGAGNGKVLSGTN